MVYRILAALIGLLMAVNALTWITTPADAAASMGMTVQTGLGLSSQVGDMTAFFASIALFCFIGAWRQTALWLYSAAIVLGLTALFRTAAWLFHGADLAEFFIAVEVVCVIVLLIVAGLMPQKASNS